MPLKRLLDQSRAFDPKAVAVLLEAFNEVVAELDLRNNTDKERAAKIIIRLALGHESPDAGKLRAEVVRLMRKDGVRGRRRPL
jgi:hypothetical protein